MAILDERRRDAATARVIDHGVSVACTHGWRYATHYLENQGVPAATIQRVLSGDGCARAGASCAPHWYGVPARERDSLPGAKR